MLNSDLSPAVPQGGRLPATYKTRVVSTRRRVPTNWVSGRTLQRSIESVVANSFVPSDFLVDGQVSALGTVQPLLTLSFVSIWILPLHVVWWCGGVDPIPCVNTHRISDPRSGPAQLLPPHVKQRSYPHGVRPQIPDR